MVRPTMSINDCCARPAITEPARKTMRPATNSRRRPIRSPSRPKSSSKPPKTSVYALSTHCDPLAVKFIARRIAGNAILTTVVSTTARNEAAHNSASAIRGRSTRTLCEVSWPATPGYYPGSCGSHVSGWRGSVVHQPLHHVVVNVGKERADHVLDLVKSFRTEQQRLVVRNVVSLNAHPADVQWPEFGAFDLLNFPVRGEQAGAVGTDFAVLAYHAEFEREPEDL